MRPLQIASSMENINDIVRFNEFVFDKRECNMRLEQTYQYLHRDSVNDKQDFNCALDGFQQFQLTKWNAQLCFDSTTGTEHLKGEKPHKNQKEKKKKKICTSRGATLIDMER